MSRPARKTNPTYLRASHIVAERIKGKGLQEIADGLGLTAGRIHQILAETMSVRQYNEVPAVVVDGEVLKKTPLEKQVGRVKRRAKPVN